MIKETYLLKGPEDFVRLDAECAELLKDFCRWLQTDEGGNAEPLEAGKHAHAADGYLRDFVVDIKETGPAEGDPAMVRQYLLNWHILNYMDPSPEDLEFSAASIALLYKYLWEKKIISKGVFDAIIEGIPKPAIFIERLNAFHNLTPQGVKDWRAADDYRKKT